MHKEFIIGGETVAADFNAFGRMIWCSRWDLVGDMVKAGLLGKSNLPNTMNDCALMVAG